MQDDDCHGTRHLPSQKCDPENGIHTRFCTTQREALMVPDPCIDSPHGYMPFCNGRCEFCLRHPGDDLHRPVTARREAIDALAFGDGGGLVTYERIA